MVANDSAEGTETVLVVDDDDAVRYVISHGLTQRGYIIIEARSGEAALEAAGEHNGPIHLVISDVAMPDMDGPTLFEHLRRWYPRLSWLFMSGYNRDAITEGQLESPRTAFVAKPFTIEVLARQVRVLMDAR